MSEGAGDIYAAEAFIETGNFDAAIKSAREILAQEPENVAALTVLASAHISKSELKEAKAAATELRAIAPGDDFGHRAMAVCLLGEKDKRGALAAAEKAVECDPLEPANQVILALVFEEFTRFEDAEGAYRHALELSPDYVFAKSSYAEFLLARGRVDEAAELVEDVSREAPDDMAVILVRARQALLAGDIDEAKDNVMWALQQDATDPEAIHMLAQIKMRTNPIMGLWWRYAIWMQRFTNWQRWLLVIGLYAAWRFFYATIAKALGPAAVPFVFLWFVFCILTWIGPLVLNHMVKRELKAVKIKPF